MNAENITPLSPDDANLAIDIRNLSKVYGGGPNEPPKLALDDVTLQIPKGSIFGLLGPNGAGKSTLINIMAGLVLHSAGTVRIWGHEIYREPRLAKSAIGVVPQEINYDPFFTPEKLLDIQAGLYGVPKAERRTNELLEMVGLEKQSKAYTRSLSGGMKRRLMVAKAMVHNPPILVLDEPTAGVDVELRQKLWENIRALNQRGTTILLTTHYLEEAEELCDQIAIINKGKVIINEDTSALMGRMNAKTLKFVLDRPLPADLPSALAAFAPERVNDRTLQVHYNPSEQNAGAIITAVQGLGAGIDDILTRQSSLEDIFVHLTRAG